MDLETRCDHLKKALQGNQNPDIEIFLVAVERNLRQNLFFSRTNADQAISCLREGESRAAAAARNDAAWSRQTGTIVLGYRSKIDGSVQPYQIYAPTGFDFASKKPVRLDIFLHGRSANLNEINFIRSAGWMRSAFGGATHSNLVLYPYGRGNNGWRWAGEQDLFEALADLQKRFNIDPDGVTLRGFSMGGHGAWHIGLQHPGDWAAVSPGAGFVDTKQYRKITEMLPAWQESLLHLYDPIDYAANSRNLPLWAFVGALDPARAQHDLMYAALRKEGAPFEELLGPETPHRYHPESLRRIVDELNKARRKPQAAVVDFVTYTLRWPECKWVRIEGLEHHWQRAEVHARDLSPLSTIEINTRNVSSLTFTIPRRSPAVRKLPINSERTLIIDGKTIKLSDMRVHLVKGSGGWDRGEQKGLRKKPGLQGPIDDALFGPVLVVSGTGKPWTDGVGRWTSQELDRFRSGWVEYFRAELPVKADKDLTGGDGRTHNLYLFGDPGSNLVLRRLLPKLPIKWSPEAVTVVGQTFQTRDHLPMLIYPNPENPERYVVINCGFTFSRADWQGSNAQQYPHLPDYAVIRYDPEHFSDDRTKDVEAAGFFDERWRVR